MTYTYRSVIVPGAVSTTIGGINDAGTLSGGADIPGDGYGSAWMQGVGGADVYGAGGAPYGSISIGEGINKAGQIVGTSGRGSAQRGYLLTADKFNTPINGPGNGYQTWAYGLNDNGQVVGAARPTDASATTTTDGYVWQGGSMTLFAVPGATSTGATAINDSGTIVGYDTDGAYTSGPTPQPVDHGFIDVNGTFTPFDVPGAVSTQINAIDTAGDLAGSAFDGAHWHGWIDKGGTMTFINAPGATDTWVTAENNSDQLAGYFASAAFNGFEGFVATDPPAPVAAAPTPSTHAGSAAMAFNPHSHVAVAHHHH